LPQEEIAKISDSRLAESIMRVRSGNIHIEGGYDGVFGKIHIYHHNNPDKLQNRVGQSALF
jgi:PHP family Zn ribbon phosphoesterase